LPEDMPYKEVIQRAAQRGLKLSKHHIFSQRADDRIKQIKAAARATEVGAIGSDKPRPSLDCVDVCSVQARRNCRR
jgi:hypothetical protein